MKPFLILYLLSCALSSLGQSTGSPIAIVELFTSQGCSSCPSADRLLKEAVIAKSELGEVYGLSFHVSYWNRLGWTDPYSSDQYTERQRWYAGKMRLGRIYTPQMIVDGQEEFVGSQKAKLTQTLKSSFADNRKQIITMSNIKRTGSQVSFQYKSNMNTNGMVINIAIVQKNATNRVPRGENRHKTLSHTNVVCAFKTQPFLMNDNVMMEIPDLEKAVACEIILYAQHRNTLEITAVGKSAL